MRVRVPLLARHLRAHLALVHLHAQGVLEVLAHLLEVLLVSVRVRVRARVRER